MSCFGKRQCRKMKFEGMRAPIVAEGIGGSFQESPAISATFQNPISLEDRQTVTTLSGPTKLRANVPLNSEAVGHTNFRHSKKRSKLMCLFRHSLLRSQLCELWFKKKVTGTMEKYFLFHEKFSFLCVITTSDSGSFIRSCYDLEIPQGPTAILSDHLCNLFKQKYPQKPFSQI